MGTNPWLAPTRAGEPVPVVPVDTAELGAPHATGAQRPQAGLPAIDTVDRLPVRDIPDGDDLWVLGVHGGAGESTLATWLGARAAGHAWPIANSDSPARVLLVARTNAAGVEAACGAATEWAGASVSVSVVGLVLIADAPGRLPPPLRASIRQLSGTVPATWALRYAPSMRLSTYPPATPPAEVAKTVRSITQATAATRGKTS